MKKVSQSTKPITALLAVALITGCASTVQYGDARAVETVDTSFGSTDLQTTATKMVDSLLTFPSIQAITASRQPIVYVDRVRNKTSEHIDTESVTDSVVNQLLRSAKFQFVDMSNIEAVKSQLDYQSNSGLVDQSQAVSLGRRVGAEYVIYGNVSSITKNSKKEQDVYYKVTLKMQNLQTGILVWQDEKEIRKSVRRSVFGW